VSESHAPVAAACLAVGAAFALRTVLAAPGTTLTVPLQAQGASGISGAATPLRHGRRLAG